MMIGLLTLLYVFAGSFLAHEYGHVYAGRLFGWRYVGWYLKLPWAVGVKMQEPPEGHRGYRFMVAGGVSVNAVLAMMGCLIGDTPLGMSLLVWNLVMILFNLIPLKGVDGYNLIRGWRPA